MTLNHVDNIESVASYMRFYFIGLSCEMKSIFITTVINVRAGRTVPAVAPKRTGGSTAVFKITSFRQLGFNKNVTYIITLAISY